MSPTRAATSSGTVPARLVGPSPSASSRAASASAWSSAGGGGRGCRAAAAAGGATGCSAAGAGALAGSAAGAVAACWGLPTTPPASSSRAASRESRALLLLCLHARTRIAGSIATNEAGRRTNNRGRAGGRGEEGAVTLEAGEAQQAWRRGWTCSSWPSPQLIARDVECKRQGFTASLLDAGSTHVAGKQRDGELSGTPVAEVLLEATQHACRGCAVQPESTSSRGTGKLFGRRGSSDASMRQQVQSCTWLRTQH